MDKESWTEVMGEFYDANIYQTWSYGSVRWGKNNLHHIIVRNNNKIVAAVQLAVKRIPLLNIGVVYTYLGPMWKTDNNDDLEAFDEIIENIKSEYSKNYLVRIVPMIINENQNIINSLEKHGYVRSSSKIPYRTFILDLKPSLDEIRKSFKQKWRNQLNAAEKNNLMVYDGDSNEYYTIFLKLQKEMLDRKKYVPGVDYNEFGQIQNSIDVSQKMKIFICEKDGEPISVAVVSAIGKMGIYLLGATGEKGLKFKGSYLIQWKILQWLKDKQCEWYDLGGINPEVNPGVFLFKSGLAGKDITYIGTYEYSNGILCKIIMKYLDYIRSKIKVL